MAKVKSPNPNYSGVSAGVRFVEGVGEFDPKKQIAAREYFDRHGFAYDGGKPEQPAAVTTAEVVDKPLDKLTIAELLAVAETRGVDVSEVDQAKKKPLIDAIEKAGATPVAAAATTAGEGPTGPQHNEGRDGANPDGQEPPVTPAPDAGI